MSEATPEAPYGFLPDGVTPRKRPPYKKKTDAAASKPPAPGKKRTRNKASTTAEQTTARAEGLRELIKIPAVGLIAAGQATKSTPLTADGIVLLDYSGALSDAVADLAAQEDRVAALVDALVQSTPYTALIGAVIPVALQLAANHVPAMVPIAGAFGGGTAESVVASRVARENREREEKAAVPEGGPAAPDQHVDAVL
jgi:hypothetical protein